MPATIPDGVGAVSLAVVGNVRVLLRSDGRYHCVGCDVAELADLVAGGFPSCQHIADLSKRGLVRELRDLDGRIYPEFVWHRGGQKVAAHWPPSDDPDNARRVLEGVLYDAMPREWRRDPTGAGDACAAVAENILVNLRYKGYVVMPEWLGAPRPAKHAPSTRGRRVLDLEDEP